MADRTDTFYAADAIHGYGAQLLVGDGASPEQFQAIALVSRITFGDMTTAVIDKTHLRSPEAHREKLLGLRDSGPFSLEGIYSPTDESQSNAGGGSGPFATGGLLAIWRRREERNFILRLNDGSPETELPFRGAVSKYQPGEVGADDKINFTAEITPLQDFSASMP